MRSLLSTLQALPDAARAEAERSLLPVARDAALGTLAVDVAHDVGNALFGLVGLVDLALDGTPIDSERAGLIRAAEADVEAAFRPLLEFPRGAADERPGDLAAAARAALRLVRHGGRRLPELVERLPDGAVSVGCPAGLLLQAVVHVLLATEPGARQLVVEVREGELLAGPPAAGESLHALAAARIAADHGGALEREADRWRLRLR